jgi:hypothetical protein
MLSAFPKSFEIVVDRTMQLVLDATRTWFEVARPTCLDIASKLNDKLVQSSFFSDFEIVIYLLLPAIVARALHTWLMFALRHARRRVLHQPIFTTVLHPIITSIASLSLPSWAISKDRALARARRVVLQCRRYGRQRLMR